MFICDFTLWQWCIKRKAILYPSIKELGVSIACHVNGEAEKASLQKDRSRSRRRIPWVPSWLLPNPNSSSFLRPGCISAFEFPKVPPNPTVTSPSLELILVITLPSRCVLLPYPTSCLKSLLKVTSSENSFWGPAGRSNVCILWIASIYRLWHICLRSYFHDYTSCLYMIIAKLLVEKDPCLIHD